MMMVPTNPAQFLLGTNRGTITNFVSSKAVKLIGPRIYRNDFDMATEVICISFSLEPIYFLYTYVFKAGFSSGHILLYEISSAQPILILEPPEQIQQPLLQVFFSPRPAIGFSNGKVQLHRLSQSSSNRDSRKQNKSLSNAIKIFKDL
uniref:Transducin/WD40 repeat-like superfamily protein n=1 Tax=Elaeophora elaphi TaxID=1147741 RepID=A0A0R3RHV4_9BILA